MIENLVAWDTSFFLYLNHLGNDNWDAFWMTITNKFTWIPFYLLLLGIVWAKYNWKIMLLTLLVAAAMVGTGDQITNLFKNVLVQRPRPCFSPEIHDVVRLVKSHCGGKYGFFSGHATNHFAVAVFFGLLFKKHKWVLPFMLFWSGMIAYSRVYIGVHYPLDIFCGAMMGSGLGVVFHLIWKKLSTQFQKTPH